MKLFDNKKHVKECQAYTIGNEKLKPDMITSDGQVFDYTVSLDKNQAYNRKISKYKPLLEQNIVKKNLIPIAVDY